MLQMYRCEKCGTIFIVGHKGACTPSCCGEEMKLVTANTVDAAVEKHVPAVEVAGNKVIVKVGEVEHPMTEVHHISKIILETSKGYQLAALNWENKPVAEFALADGETAVAAYEYCTLHGLWKKAL